MADLSAVHWFLAPQLTGLHAASIKLEYGVAVARSW